MLHILLLILKIIGIIIAVILGILVLLLCIVFFVPVRYEVQADFDGTLAGIRIRAKVSWLLRLIRGTVVYENQQPDWQIGIAWKTIGSRQESKESMKEEVGAHEEELEQQLEKSKKKTEKEFGRPSEVHEKDSEERKEDMETHEEVKESGKSSEEGLEETPEDYGGSGSSISEVRQTGAAKSKGNGCTMQEKAAGAETSVEPEERGYAAGTEPGRDTGPETVGAETAGSLGGAGTDETSSSWPVENPADDSKKRGRLWQKIVEGCRGFVRKIQGTYVKIKCTIQIICDKIKAFSEKTEEAVKTKNEILDFLSDDVHQKAFLKGKDEVFRLLRRLKPKKLVADIRFGFEDPCMTGQVLAVLSVLYPFLGEEFSVTPDFEQKILEGNLQVAGKIRVSYFVRVLWDLFWCKNVRITFRNARTLYSKFQSA